MGKSIYIIVHNVRSAYNVGAILRTADGLGASLVYLTGYTPAPMEKNKSLTTGDRRCKPLEGCENENTKGNNAMCESVVRDKIYQTAAQKMIAKTALGAENFILWKKEKSIGNVIKKLKNKKFQIVALEQSKKSLNYTYFKPKFPIALIIGNEPKGIDKKILKQCDTIIEIPMRGQKNSLNVAVALGVAGYQLTNYHESETNIDEALI